ncbi:putative transcription factor SOX-14 [Clonorchis sinensis]|uniref:Putative transcription factor SOX-14 n=1 Tax=Clonorchis sinensis TaxID=79923 RepID=H2KRD1_CLOSI|nr:putative transcription factor SOX-14 [Clonorchis sinensis]
MWMHDCSSCASAKSDGLQAWMRHLTEHHVIPTEWPSDRAAKLTGPPAVRPYTTITESKKKRRKDSIPRPLNSFMLFAQHIRRNVLRVFSDASNSVISQQLGDLWRTVPHNFRTQYDDEANRLVKIHLLEFPNYKYQPKKRQPVTSAATTSGVISHTVAAPSNSGDYARMAGRSAIRLGSSETRSVADNTGTQQNSPIYFKPRLSTADSAPAVMDNSARLCFTKTEDQPSGTYFYHSANDSTAFRLISPAKLSPKTGVTTHITEQPSQLKSNSCTLHSTTSIAHSLSSVLPPLITPSSKSATTSTVDFYTQTSHYGSCDSAYASGINSSSSSSASSPAVGDLLSPTKPISILGSCTKSSPVRRKIQFIPIRPQSQQPLHSSSGMQLTRQRFLSANNGLPDQSHSNRTVLSTSHPSVSNAARSDNTIPVYRLDSSDANIVTLNGGRRVHQLVAPVYVRLDAESSGTNEDVILTLPPGTTIIQTVGDLRNFPVKTGVLQAHSMQGGQLMLAHPVGKTASSVADTPIPTADFFQLTGSAANGEPSSASEDMSPLPYSCSSASPPAWSPLSGDVFLPLHHVHTTAALDDDANCTAKSSTYSLMSNTDSGTYLYESEDSVMDSHFDCDTDLVDKVKIEPVRKTESHNDELFCGIRYTSPIPCEHATEYSTTWTSSTGAVEFTHNNQNGSITGTGSSFIPLAIDVAKADQSSDQLIMESETPMSDFPMANEDNFDASFDAMMNSFDITAFLPGTYSTNDDLVVGEEFAEENYSTKTQGRIVGADSFRHDQTSIEERRLNFDRRTLCPEEATEGTNFNSTIDVDDMLTNIDSQRAVIVTNDYCSTTPYLPDHSKDVNKVINNAIASNHDSIVSDIQSRYQNQMNSQHSPLSDLDALDKSSLLIIKPDWSLRV